MTTVNKFEVSDHLRSNESVAGYLAACYEEGGLPLFQQAFSELFNMAVAATESLDDLVARITPENLHELCGDNVQVMRLLAKCAPWCRCAECEAKLIPVDSALVNRLTELVDGVEFDIDEPLPNDEEHAK